MKFLHEMLLDLDCMCDEESFGVGLVNFWTCCENLEKIQMKMFMIFIFNLVVPVLLRIG